jgi:hypothetical protein
MIQTGLGKNQDPISRITRAQRAAGVARALEHLPSKCEALSLNLSTSKKKKKRSLHLDCDFHEMCESVS